MKVKKMKVILILMVMLLTLGMVKVQAASFKFIANPNVTIGKPGDTITISLKLSDINVGELGVNTFSAKLAYDENVFEGVEVISKNNWSITYNNEKENEAYGTLLAVLLSTGVTENQEIGEVKLKIKQGVKAQKSNITFTNVVTNDGNEDIKESDKTVAITIEGEKEEEPTNNNTTNNTNTTDTNNTTNTTNTANNVNQNENLSTKPLPQTGETENYVLIGITILVVIGIIAFMKYKKMN